MAENNTYYINGSSLATATAVFSSAAMNGLAPQGYYTDGEVIRYQSISGNQALFADISGDCNTCTTDCSNNILVSQSYVTAASMQGSVSFGTDTGAIRVDIAGVATKPVGVDLEFDGNSYNYFASNLTTSIEKYQAPTPGIKSYFWSVNGVGFCSPWDLGVVVLDVLNFNPNSGLWEDTGNNISQTTTNRMNAGFPAIAGSVGSQAGILTTYIPKTAADPSKLLQVVFETPCGPSVNNQGFINGPTLTISCPVELSSFNSSVSHNNPCSQTAINQARYIGPVRSTTPGVLAVGDFLFDDINGSNPTADGEYKALGSDLEGVTNAAGSFTVLNGIVTSMSNC